MRYRFLVETYASERVKVASVWSEFHDEDLSIRPNASDPRGRSVLEQMVHQCVSEDLWFRNMLGIDVSAPPLPSSETRIEFIKRYAEDSGKRLTALQPKDEAWWEEEVKFFEVQRSRAWVMLRRIAHTSHHRGQLMAMLSHRGHWWLDGESCADDLRIWKPGAVIGGWTEGEAAGGRRESRDGEAVSRFTILDTGIDYGILFPVMESARKITVEVPQELLEKAQQATGTGITQTIRVGLTLVAASRAYARIRKLRGKVHFSHSLTELKSDR